MPGRHVILLLDGTDCSATGGFRRHFSNVFRFGSAISGKQFAKATTSSPADDAPERIKCIEPHIVLYFPGPGTRKIPSRRLNALTGFETNEIVKEAYISLCTNIVDPRKDRLYIIGYSRGAAAAKILVALLRRFGLLDRANIHQFGNLWSSFYRSDATRQKFTEAAQHIQIPFVGLFDPVSGPEIGNNRYKISKIIDGGVDNAVEVIAIDERRRFFVPKFWSLPVATVNDVVAQKFGRRSQLQQIWIPGSHGDIGHPEDGSVIADVAFLSMIERLCSYVDIDIDRKYVQKIHESLVSGSGKIEIKCKGLSYIWKKRRIPKSTSTEIHPLYALLKSNKVLFNNKSVVYGVGYQDVDDLNTYSFDLNGLIGKSTANSEVIAALTDKISQQI